jgi:hypothetical protein
MVVPQFRQAVSSESINYFKPLDQRTPVSTPWRLHLQSHTGHPSPHTQELFDRTSMFNDPECPVNRPEEGDWNADVLMRYHASKQGEYS